MVDVYLPEDGLLLDLVELLDDRPRTDGNLTNSNTNL